MRHIPYIDDFFKFVKKGQVGDGVDRMIGVATVLICTISAMIIFSKQLMGEPMTCWTPTLFKGDQAKYAVDYCYIQNTYVVDFQQLIITKDRSKYTKVNYYQWLSLYFLLQAAIFFLPGFLWQKWYRNNEMDIESIVKKGENLRSQDNANKEKTLKEMSISILDTISENRNKRRRSFFGRSHAVCPSTLTYKYLIIKALNLTIIGFFITQVADYLDHTDFFWAIQGFHALATGTAWSDSPNFPRVTMCDLQVRDLGNIKNHTIQCLLGMNYINEKIFFIEWAWLFLIMCIAAYNIIYFFWTVFLPQSRMSKLLNWLNRRPDNHIVKDTDARSFGHLLGLDGFLTLYFLEVANGSRAASNFAVYLYKQTEKDRNNLVPKNLKKKAAASFFPVNLDALDGVLRKQSTSSAADLIAPNRPNTPELPEKVPFE